MRLKMINYQFWLFYATLTKNPKSNLDVLRHRPDGRIYIIDVNNTPDGGEIQFEREDIKKEAVAFLFVERLKRTLQPNHRQVILEIKRHFYQEGSLRDGLSLQIYEAVVDHGVQNLSEFQRYLAES